MKKSSKINTSNRHINKQSENGKDPEKNSSSIESNYTNKPKTKDLNYTSSFQTSLSSNELISKNNFTTKEEKKNDSLFINKAAQLENQAEVGV
jgi:hypothetical protein